MNAYTVIGLYPDDVLGDVSCIRDGSFVHQIEAPTPTVAARWARRDLCPAGHEPDDLEIVAVLEGNLRDQYEPSLDNEAYEADVTEDSHE